MMVPKETAIYVFYQWNKFLVTTKSITIYSEFPHFLLLLLLISSPGTAVSSSYVQSWKLSCHNNVLKLAYFKEYWYVEFKIEIVLSETEPQRCDEAQRSEMYPRRADNHYFPPFFFFCFFSTRTLKTIVPPGHMNLAIRSITTAMDESTKKLAVSTPLLEVLHSFYSNFSPDNTKLVLEKFHVRYYLFIGDEFIRAIHKCFINLLMMYSLWLFISITYTPILYTRNLISWC